MTVCVLWLILTVPWVHLQCVIVVFPGHTHFFSFLMKALWTALFIFSHLIDFLFRHPCKDILLLVLFFNDIVVSCGL